MSSIKKIKCPTTGCKKSVANGKRGNGKVCSACYRKEWMATKSKDYFRQNYLRYKDKTKSVKEKAPPKELGPDEKFELSRKASLVQDLD